MKRIIILITLILTASFGLNAYSKDAAISKDTLLYVKDHAGGNFLVVKVDECVYGAKGEVLCAMKPQPQAKPTVAGPKGSFWDKLSYSN